MLMRLYNNGNVNITPIVDTDISPIVDVDVNILLLPNDNADNDDNNNNDNGRTFILGHNICGTQTRTRIS